MGGSWPNTRTRPPDVVTIGADDDDGMRIIFLVTWPVIGRGFREPAAPDLALKKFKSIPFLDPKFKKKKQPESRILLCPARSYLNNT